MKKFITDIRALGALIIAFITMIACSSENNIADDQPIPPAQKTFTLTVEAKKADGGAMTRALDLTGEGEKTLTATWVEGDQVTVYNETKSETLGGYLEAKSSGTETTLKGTLTGTIEAGDNLTLKFCSPNYTSQDGTLEYIAANCDYAEAPITVSTISDGVIKTTGNAIFTNKQAIVKFTLKDKADGTTLLSPSDLTVNDGTNDVAILSIPSTTYTTNESDGVLYVAIPGFNSKTVTLTANVDGDTYKYTTPSNVSFANSQYYSVTVKMDFDPQATPLTIEAIGETVEVVIHSRSGSAGSWDVKYKIDDGPWLNRNVMIDGGAEHFSGKKLQFIARFCLGGKSEWIHIQCDNDCFLYGNILSLTQGDGYATSNESGLCGSFFENNTHIRNHSIKKMVLPATSLSFRSYYQLFSGCTALTSAPELPATILTEGCYYEMFKGCTNLNSIKCLATDISATDCTKSWVDDVSATGTFTKPASTDYSSMAAGSGIPSGWSTVNL